MVETMGSPEAHLAAADYGRPQRFAVSLEAKSVRRAGTRVSAHTVDVAAVARHRDELNFCDHAIVVAPEFLDARGEDAAIIKQIRRERELTN